MRNFYKDNADLQFYVEKGVDWSWVVELTERRFVDADGPKDLTEAKEIYRDLKSLVGDLHGLAVPRELGGMNLPMLVYFLNSEILGRADVSVMAHHGFQGGIAMALLHFSR